MGRAVAELLDEAAAAPVAGWDFTWGWGSGRVTTVSPVPWDFATVAADALRTAAVALNLGVAADALRTAAVALDLGTGGGEFLERFTGLPARMVATESWPPNVPVAAERLAGRGVPTDVPVYAFVHVT